MPTRTQHITHRFDGGWATDFGALVSGLPTQTSEIRLPFVLEAKNIFWTLDGGFRKIGGTAVVGAEQESGATIMGVYDYWRIGASGSATRRKVCHVGTKIKEDQDTGTWQDLFSSLTADAHPNYSTFNDLLIIASDSSSAADAPRSWDQTTPQNLAGTPPNFAFSVEHKNRLWAAGVATNPSRLYYSVADDPEDWIGTGSGFIDISAGDGDEITGLASFKNELWVFKGPNKGSIHRITGASPSDFARVVFVHGLACIGHSTIVQLRDDLLFMTPSGSIRSLKATAAFGDYNDTAITNHINTWLIDNLNFSKLYQSWAVADPANSLLYISVPTGSSTTNNVVLVYDYQFQQIGRPDRWSRITDWDTHSLASAINAGLPVIYGGGADGYVRQVNISTRNIDTTGAIDSRVQTPHLNYGSSTQYKTFADLGLTLSPTGNESVDFEWIRDSIRENAIVLNQGDATVELGDSGSPDSADFMLSIDELGGLIFNEVYADMEEGGSFRWIQYQFVQDSIDDDIHLYAFSTGLQFDAFGTE